MLLAAGEGTRMLSSDPKAFLRLGGQSLLRRSALAAARSALVEGIVVAVPRGSEERARAELDGIEGIAIVAGGASRQASAWAALDAATGAEAVVVHDAARPLAPPELFDACLEGLEEAEAVVCALPVRDTIKEVERDVVVATPDRSRLVAVQTPQAFRAGLYRRAHERAARDGFEATDDAALVERIGVDVRVVRGHERNVKITTPFDVFVAEALLRAVEV